MKILRQTWTALRALLVLTIVLGLVYPVVITAAGQLAFPDNANGQILTVDGESVGSALIGQSFTDADGNPLAQWFQSRPSAAGSGYDGGSSSGSNFGPENEDLLNAIGDRQAAIGDLDAVPRDSIPADAVTASGSGLDPHISPEYARVQVDRVARERGLPESSVAALVESMIQERDLGFLGEARVNVLQLNIALAELNS